MSRNIEIGWNRQANINRHSLAIRVSSQQYEAIQKGWKSKWQRLFLFIISASPTSSALKRDETKKKARLWDSRNYCTMKDHWRNKHIYVQCYFSDIASTWPCKTSLSEFILRTNFTEHWLCWKYRAINEYQSTLDHPTFFFATGRQGSCSGNIVSDRIPRVRLIMWRRHHLKTLRYIWIPRKAEV